MCSVCDVCVMCARGAGPLPPLSLSVERATSNSVVVRWRGPAAAASALGEFLLRYRTHQAQAWARQPPYPPHVTSAEVCVLKALISIPNAFRTNPPTMVSPTILSYMFGRGLAKFDRHDIYVKY